MLKYPCFVSENLRMHPRMHRVTDAKAYRAEDRSLRRRSSRDVVLITVLTQKVTCVLLFDTYNKDKVEFKPKALL
jgi:hypothetical protein